MECWNLKNEEEDFIPYTRVVNCMYKIFKLQDLTQDMFKSFIFIKGLISPEDRGIQTRIQPKIEQANQDLSLKIKSEKCQTMVNFTWEKMQD